MIFFKNIFYLKIHKNNVILFLILIHQNHLKTLKKNEFNTVFK